VTAAIVYVPFLQTIFGTVGLGLSDWVFLSLFPMVVVAIDRATKAHNRRRAARLEKK